MTAKITVQANGHDLVVLVEEDGDAIGARIVRNGETTTFNVTDALSFSVAKLVPGALCYWLGAPSASWGRVQ